MFHSVFRSTLGRLWFPWRGQLALGVALALFGALVLVYPMILVALVATLFLGVGVTLALTALRLRRLEQQVRRAWPFEGR